MERIELTDAEAERLAEILNRAFSPPPALRKALSRLADPKRQPPKLRWPDKGREAFLEKTEMAFKWVTVAGELQPGVDLDSRDSLYELMEGRESPLE